MYIIEIASGACTLKEQQLRQSSFKVQSNWDKIKIRPLSTSEYDSVGIDEAEVIEQRI